MKKNQLLDIKWIFYILISCVYAVCQINLIMYTIFLCEFVIILRALWYEDYELFKKEQIELLFVSLMMPDNYLIIAVVTVLLIINLPRVQWKITFGLGISILYLVLNVILNSVNFVNLFFAILYNVPLVLVGYVIKKKADNVQVFRELTLLNAKRLILLEGITVIVYMLTHLSEIRSYIDMDWVTGTLGMYQCNTLMLLASFSFLMFLDDFMKNRTSLIWAIASLAIAMCTTSVAYTLILIVTIVAMLFLSRQINLKVKACAIGGVCIGIVVFLSISPDWIVNEIPKLMNTSYLQERIHKIEYYENTFVDIPQEEGILAWAFGNGIGEYSSRAASTCAGGYIGLYDKFFEPYVSDVRAKYITDEPYDKAFWGKSVVDTPGSSVLAIQGELGIIGLIICAMTFVNLYRNANGLIPKMVVVFFCGLMFVESVLGFLKYGVIFLLAYYITNTDVNLNRTQCD